MPDEVRADAALTEIMPVLGRGRFSRWYGTLPLSAVTKRRPGSTYLPGRPTADSPLTLDGADPDLLARVLAGLRAL
ncbi:ABC-type microcin C transport system permease subunit YejE [Actinopolyspora lacussalsi]|nr:ABC-type microcin C transport system permease subunit YejE [Actinopolyspora lacussalsi]